jgi:hypothetical protein
MHDRRPAAGERLEAGTGGEGFLVVLKGLGERSEALAQRSLPWASASMIPAASTDEDGPEVPIRSNSPTPVPSEAPSRLAFQG